MVSNEVIRAMVSSRRYFVSHEAQGSEGPFGGDDGKQ